MMLRMEKERVPDVWKRLHVGGVNRTSCQHLQVLATNSATKALGVPGRKSLPCCGIAASFAQPCFMASLDIKTAFEAKPRHVASIMEGHGIHG